MAQDTKEEILKISRENDKEDKRRAELFEGLMRAPAFIEYCSLLNKLIEGRGMDILQPANSVDGAFALEHVKGTMFGLILARDLVPVIVTAMKPTSEPDGADDAT